MRIRAACCLLALFLAPPAAITWAFPPDAPQQMQNLYTGAQVESLPAGKWTVVEDFVPPSGAATQPQRQREADISAAVSLNDQVLLEERGMGRCLWGSRQGPTTQHAHQVFASFEQFVEENAFAPLPKPPAGWSIRQVAAMPQAPVKLVANPDGSALFVLCLGGDVYRIALPNGSPQKIVEAAKFAQGEEGQFLGICLDRERRLYLVGNRFDFSVTPILNHVTIYRTRDAIRDGAAIEPRPWVTADIPFAIDVFQHSVSYIAQGPDGFVYVSSGSRTDHGEAGNNPRRSKEGETPLTSCIWRLDPRSDSPKIEIFARGLRNAFGFCWDDKGRMFATENGPNADPPEEVNLVEQGKHYGFPFQFADWDHKAYPDQPDLPPGLKIEPPLAKLDPHSSPSGIVFYDGTLLVARFGNLIGPKDVGFDIVQVEPTSGTVTPFLAPIARPTDLQLAPATGKIYVCEYQRQTRNAGGDFPGRILEISTPHDISPATTGTH